MQVFHSKSNSLQRNRYENNIYFQKSHRSTFPSEKKLNTKICKTVNNSRSQDAIEFHINRACKGNEVSITKYGNWSECGRRPVRRRCTEFPSKLIFPDVEVFHEFIMPSRRGKSSRCMQIDLTWKTLTSLLAHTGVVFSMSAETTT